MGIFDFGRFFIVRQVGVPSITFRRVIYSGVCSGRVYVFGVLYRFQFRRLLGSVQEFGTVRSVVYCYVVLLQGYPVRFTLRPTGMPLLDFVSVSMNRQVTGDCGQLVTFDLFFLSGGYSK